MTVKSGVWDTEHSPFAVGHLSTVLVEMCSDFMVNTTQIQLWSSEAQIMAERMRLSELCSVGKIFHSGKKNTRWTHLATLLSL